MSGGQKNFPTPRVEHKKNRPQGPVWIFYYINLSLQL